MSREKAPAPPTASHARRARPRSIRSTLISLMVIPLISLMALWAYAATSTIGGAFAQRAYDTENSATGGPDSALLDQLIQERTLTYIWMSSGRRRVTRGDGQAATADRCRHRGLPGRRGRRGKRAEPVDAPGSDTTVGKTELTRRDPDRR